MSATAVDGLVVAPATVVAPLEALCALKGVRVAGEDGSLADRLFACAWGALARGADVHTVSLATVARTLVATRLPGIDAELLTGDGGVTEDRAVAVLRRALQDALAGSMTPVGVQKLAGALGSPTVTGEDELAAPSFAHLLGEQPRAGVTAPGLPRLALDLPESHAEHCLAVACAAALLVLAVGGDPSRSFLCGLAHHLHNARVPDAGFAGESLLGSAVLARLVSRARERALSELPLAVAGSVRDALALVDDDAGVDAQAFQAADVLDRVLQLRRYERQAAFVVAEALERYEIVHVGPLQSFGRAVLAAAGLA